jgi:hypothetical protein
VIILFHGGGAVLTEVHGPSLPTDEWNKLRQAVARLLVARGDVQSAELLEKYPFELVDGTNYFQDEFSVLYARVPLEQYVELGEIQTDAASKQAFRLIAETITEIGPFTRFVAAALDTDERVIPVAPPSPRVTSEAVERALADAEHLIRSRGPSSAVDRVHTALHGYLRAVLERSGVVFPQDASITALFKLLRENNPPLRDLGYRSEDAIKMIRAMSTIVDSLNTLRNLASGAHPTEQVLAEAEAMLAINATRTLLHYLDEKLED